MNKRLKHIENLRKLFRFATIYGWSRALNKAIARTRPGWLRQPFVPRRQGTISVIGCGQFAFSCVCYFLQKHTGNAFLSAFDTNPEQSRSLAGYYGFREVTASADALLNQPALTVLYVVSNHGSHAQYAVAGLRRHKLVYVEKPVSVSRAQLVQLVQAVRQSSGQLFAGYNRPYAKAIRLLRQRVTALPKSSPFSISYTINGHQLPADHWYRQPDEGSRICGNLGHWIDLTLHVLAWRGLPTWIDIQIACANPSEPDDNLTVTCTTDQHDLVSMLLTARSEPYEGVSESINMQYHDIIARIDDFRRMTIWQGARRETWRFAPKDVGHKRAVLQPFMRHCQHDPNRDWAEVEVSTLLMLYIRDMVVERKASARFWVHQEIDQLNVDSQLYSHMTTDSLA